MSGALAALAALSDFRTGALRVAVASDSTANDATDWLPTWLRLYAAENPGLRVTSRAWDPAALAYRPAHVVQDGCPTWTLDVLNAAVPGSRLTLHTQHAQTMFSAGPIDALICASGHNYGFGTPESFLAELDGFVQAYLALRPESAVAVSSQNPQYEPAVTAEQHKARQAALRRHATAQGWDYVPAFEVFAALPDGGASLVDSDGVHPLPSGGTTWAQAWQDEIGKMRVT